MFLSKNYVLGNELVQKLGIHIANISMLANKLEEKNDYSTIIKLNNCNFINKNSHNLPNNISKGIRQYEFTDFSNKLPVTWLRSEYELTKVELENANLIQSEIKISTKRFFVFKDWFVELMHNKIAYTLNREEMEECLKNGDILGSIEINSNKFLTYYEDFTR